MHTESIGMGVTRSLGMGCSPTHCSGGSRARRRNKGEVTVNSLFDYIDRQMGGDRQRPMMFGQMTGRVVLMHYA